MPCRDPVTLRISRILSGLGLAVGAASILAAHPWFAAGAWPQSEAVTATVFAAAALCLLGQALAVFPGGAGVPASPLVFLPAALAAWSALSAAFADFPGTALAGSPQQGLGVAWFLALAAFTAAALDIRGRRAADMVTAVAVAAVAVAVVSNLRHLPWLQPVLARHGLLVAVPLFGFNEYLAYPALALGAVGAVFVGDGRRRWGIALLVFAAMTLVASRNRTAMAVVTALLPLAVLAWPREAAIEAWFTRRPRLGAAVVAAILVVVALVPLLVLGSADLSGLPFSLRSRQVLLAVLSPSWFDRPWAMVVGHGWGHYQDYLTRNIAATGIALYRSEWADLARDEFHSHHALAETLFSAGLPAVALALATSVALVVTARRKVAAMAFVLAWTAVDSLWFSLPSVLALQALAAAALTGGGRRVWPASKRVALACLLSAVALAAGAGWMRHQSQGLEAVRACLKAPGACDSVAVPADPRGSGLGLAVLLRESAAVQAGPPPDALVREGQRRCRAGCALSLSIALADAEAARAFATPPPADFSPSLWREEEERIVARAPGRLDLLVPYLNWLLVVGDETTLRTMVAQAARVDPGHPVVAWFSGILDLAGPPDVQRRGLARMRAALAGGVERFMPVEDSVKASLRERGG